MLPLKLKKQLADDLVFQDGSIEHILSPNPNCWVIPIKGWCHEKMIFLMVRKLYENLYERWWFSQFWLFLKKASACFYEITY